MVIGIIAVLPILQQEQADLALLAVLPIGLRSCNSSGQTTTLLLILEHRPSLTRRQAASFIGDKMTDHIPPKMAALLKSWLGIDAEELSKSFLDATTMFKNFCIHFDGRMVALAREVRELRDEIVKLTQACPREGGEACAREGGQGEENGKLTITDGTASGTDVATTDQRHSFTTVERGNGVECAGDGAGGTRAA